MISHFNRCGAIVGKDIQSNFGSPLGDEISGRENYF
jgi:hypothetical protein